MTQPEEIMPSLEEQLGFSDSQLALTGIARAIDAAKRQVASTEQSVTFNRTYVPSHPGPRPHPEAGGMDHQDWEIAAWEYAHADEQQEDDERYYESKLEDDEDKLYDLLDDKESIEGGDEEVVFGYAAAERARIQAELEKRRLAKESADRYEAYLRGNQIEGAASLSAAIVDFATNPKLGEVRGSVSSSGWKFVGTGTPYKMKSLMFERMDPAAAEVPEYDHWKFNKTELLTLVVSDRGVSVEYSNATDIDEEAVKRYGANVATVDQYSCVIKDGGVVGEQRHGTGKGSKWLPHRMNDGTISGNIYRVAYDAPSARMNPGDIVKLQAVINEVVASADELAQSGEMA